MSGTFRDKLVKGGTQLLFALLVLSFIGWGVGDYIGARGPGGNQSVAEVGGTTISATEFQRAMQSQISRMRQMLGDTFTAEQARAMGLDESILQSLIEDALFDEAARKLGLIVDDSVVSQEIRNNPSFQTASGAFDKLQFENALRQAGYNESTFVAEMRGQILRGQYLSPISMGETAPKTLIDTLYRHRNEKRVAQILTVDHSAIAVAATPSDADLEKFHSDHSAQYAAPEQRAITVVRIRPADIADEIDVSEDRIKAYYDEHIAEFSTPERRTIDQIPAGSEQAARDIAARIAKGEDFDKVAKEFGGGSLGSLAKGEVPLPELAEAAFSIAPDTISAPIQSPLGWTVIRTTKVVPATRRTLAETRDEIRRHIALDLASDSLYDLAGKFEDELGGGASAEEAAKRLKLNVLKIDAVDKEGRDPAGNRYSELTPDVLATAFATDEGRDSPLSDLASGGQFLVHVDKVTPSAVKPFATVKDQVRADWIADQQAQQAEKIAQDMANEIKAGKILADVAKAHKAQLTTTEPFTRTREGLKTQLPGALVPALFKSTPGTPEIASSGTAHVVGVVSQVIAADPAADADATMRLHDEIARAVSNDLSSGLAGALREKLSVSVNRAALDTAY